MLPACVTVMEQTPVPTSVTVAPDSVHTDSEFDVKLTANPELAVAVSAKGADPNAFPDSDPNVIVCAVFPITSVPDAEPA